MVPGTAALLDGVVLQSNFQFETEALVSAVFVFLVSLLVGSGAIHLAARLLIDRESDRAFCGIGTYLTPYADRDTAVVRQLRVGGTGRRRRLARWGRDSEPELVWL